MRKAMERWRRTFAVALPLNNGAHEYFNRPNVIERDLALQEKN
jgi:hypothetical protein